MFLRYVINMEGRKEYINSKPGISFEFFPKEWML